MVLDDMYDQKMCTRSWKTSFSFKLHEMAWSTGLEVPSGRASVTIQQTRQHLPDLAELSAFHLQIEKESQPVGC